MAEALNDVVPEILANLPVKSLLRFKCVCKTWYSTISNPQFSCKLRPSALICQNSKTFSTITIESLLMGAAREKALTPLSLPWETEEDTNPLPSEVHRLADRDGNYLIGSCNGLVCVDYRSSKRGRDDLILWNPSARTFRRLPRCSRARKEFYYHHYVWFGYDESIHDYKLVYLDYHLTNPRGGTILNVFTLKSNAWRRTDDCRLLPDWRLTKVNDINNHRVIGVLSNGAIHWRVCMNNHIVILALDLATERFQVLDFANYPFDPQIGGSCLVGGCSCRYDAGMAPMSLHIVKEYGQKGIVIPKWDTLMYYPILFSSGKEILAVFDRFCRKHGRQSYDDKIIKFRTEEGGGKVSSLECLLLVQGGKPFRNNIVLHMEESLESLDAP